MYLISPVTPTNIKLLQYAITDVFGTTKTLVGSSTYNAALIIT